MWPQKNYTSSESDSPQDTKMSMMVKPFQEEPGMSRKPCRTLHAKSDNPKDSGYNLI
jgi:hypothetical protein